MKDAFEERLAPSDTLQPEDMEKATLTVVDRATGEPLYRAVINYLEKTKVTDDSGKAVIDDISKGQLVYTIEHSYYFSLTDSMMFTDDTSLVIPLTSIYADVQFGISDLIINHRTGR